MKRNGPKRCRRPTARIWRVSRAIRIKIGTGGGPEMNLIRLACFALTLLTATNAGAQSYPDHAIRIIVGFTAGSATDISARMFAQKLNEAWAVPVTVENIAGNGGSIGGERVARSPPDGTTLYWGANGAMTINPSLQVNPTFDPM